MKIMTINELILINQYVQGLSVKNKISDWFLTLSEEDKQSVVKSIWVLSVQAQVTEKDISIATAKAELKPTNGPIVMVSKGDLALNKRGYKLSQLNGTELIQAFWFVLETLVSADNRRKNEICKSECKHWWHKDLSDEQYIQELIKKVHYI